MTWKKEGESGEYTLLEDIPSQELKITEPQQRKFKLSMSKLFKEIKKNIWKKEQTSDKTEKIALKLNVWHLEHKSSEERKTDLQKVKNIKYVQNMYMYTCMCMHMYTCMYMCMCIYMCICVNMCMCMNMYMYVYVYV